MSLEKLNKKYDDLVGTFSVPNKPSTFGKAYNFPEDVANVSSMDLGKWLFRLAGWKGYVIKMLSTAESVSYIMNEVLESKATMKMAQYASDKRIVKEVLRGKVIGEDPELKELKCKCIEKNGEIMMLKRLLEMYSSQLDVISREISRRSLEIKLMQTGIINKED
jgi:hypothetical protein